uniref:Reverse transcriptase domain-containing protein n=1 Tax=Cannabis sativa TaxID=3483 RepID=A0A803Q157_CANSA
MRCISSLSLSLVPLMEDFVHPSLFSGGVITICEGDKGRVLEGQPWYFAQCITIFAAPDSSFPLTPENLHYVPFWIQVYGTPFMCKSYDLARFIAMKIGDLIEVDKDTIKEGTSPYLRLRVLLDVNLAIRRGMNIKFIRMGCEFIKWLDFKPSTFTSYSTDSLIVVDSPVSQMDTLSSVPTFPVAISGSFASIGDSAMGANSPQGQPDSTVRGKGLAPASGIKRPSFSASTCCGWKLYTQREIARIQASASNSRESSLRVKYLQSQLDALIYMEEVYWRQRSRVNWLQAGDKNTKFFHQFASQRRKNNTIKYLKDDFDNSAKDPEVMFDIISSFFTNLFSSEGCDAEATNQILDCLGPSLNEPDIDFLAQPFTAQEVKKAVFSLSGDKAPGLDGLNAFFYQKNWDTLGASFVHAVLDYLNNGVDFSDINTTLIALIPKKHHANSLKDFWPISLCTTMYKVISKVLANRLKVVLDKIISPFQSAFVSGRIIFDNILIAKEIVHAINSRKNGLGRMLNFLRVLLSLGMRLLSPIFFFADDSLLFCSADRNSCLALQEVASVLKGWSSKCFFRAGKEVLLKAVIQAIPAYAMACFKLPTKICKGIEAAMARFWWGSTGESRKIHLKSWKFLCESKFRGGLGFRSLVHFNQAMLAKHAWCILKNPNSLLSSILKARYFLQSSIIEVVPGHNPSYTWRSILWGRDLMVSGLIWKVGNGSSIRTLDDHWLPNHRHKIFINNDSPSSSTLLSYFVTDSRTCDVRKLHSCFDNAMINDILEVPVSGCYGHDVLIWKRESSGLFTVKSAYHLAFSHQDLPSSSSFSASSLFKRCVIDSPLCPICNLEIEMTKHALLDCSRFRKAWRYSSISAANNFRVTTGFSTPFAGIVLPAVAEAKTIYQAI